MDLEKVSNQDLKEYNKWRTLLITHWNSIETISKRINEIEKRNA